jgi:hypothetical protein
MLRLSLDCNPKWIDLPREVRIRIRPVTTAVVAAAQSASLRDAEALRDSGDAGGLDLTDPDVAKGLGFALMVKALARYAVLEWDGVGDRDGNPLPCTPENLALLMDLDEMATAFWRAAFAPVAAVSAEGNG